MEKKTYLYLIQVESKIPKTLEHFKNKDTIILSYKEETEDTDIFYPKSSWTTGRNKLFQEAIKRNYDYYIFLDCDLDITENKINNFENIINNFDYNYPIIAPKMWKYNTVPGNYGIKYDRKGLENKLFKNQTIDWFDGAFNAFHKDSITKLLPYVETYDNQCWHYSQLLLILKSNYLFKNKIIQLNTINIDNNMMHTFYPRNMRNVKLIVNNYIKDNNMESLSMSDAIEIV